MNLASNTGLTDHSGSTIRLGHYLVAPNNKIYQVIDDNDFGYSIVELASEVIEKLNQEVAGYLHLISYKEFYVN